jgi:hypothetical protein
MFRKSLILAAALLAGTSLGAMAGTVTPVTHVPPDGRISTASSLTAKAAT